MSSGSAALVVFLVVLRGAIILWFESDEFLYFCCESSTLAESGLLLLLDGRGFNTGCEGSSSSVLSLWNRSGISSEPLLRSLADLLRILILGSGGLRDEEGSSALVWIESKDNDAGSFVSERRFPPLTKPSPKLPLSMCSRWDFFSFRGSSSSSARVSISSDNSSGGVGNSEDSIVPESEK